MNILPFDTIVKTTVGIITNNAMVEYDMEVEKIEQIKDDFCCNERRQAMSIRDRSSNSCQTYYITENE